jgi:predicted alpha/beta hydrolase
LIISKVFFRLIYSKYIPREKIKAVVVIASALGVDKIYYQNFSLWLAELGYVVITFYYSSMSDSNEVSYKKSKTTITGWAMFDCKKVLEHASLKANANKYIGLFMV